MTAEVVVMNRLGVALASDSVASILIEGRTKLFHSDKLYMLSSCRPVGVMVYNNSALAHVPWETIIKMFRAELGSRAFASLEQYGLALMEYLEARANMFPAEAQHEAFMESLKAYFRDLQGMVRRLSQPRMSASVKDIGGLLNEIARLVLNQELAEWRSASDWTSEPDFGPAFVTGLSREINISIGECFPYLNADNVRLLMELARLAVTKCKMLPEGNTGVVIAGFGQQEHFPSLQAFEIGGFFRDKLKYARTQTVRVDGQQPAAIVPFAQTDMVHSFLYGARPSLYEEITKEVARFVVGLPDLIIDGFPRVARKRKQAYKLDVQAGLRDVASEMFRNLKELREERILQPILASIAHLPKGELAHVASTLVNLSSFQKRVSMTEDETVGGPIDVALITKGDGFVWVERKHYFKAELNSHYFRNRDAEATLEKETQDDTRKAPHKPFGRRSRRRNVAQR